MRKIEFDKLTLQQLHKLSDQVFAAIEKRQKTERKSALRELKEIARARGFSLEELLAEKTGKPASTKNRRKPATVKYRHPEQKDLAWSGRGRKPTWVAEWEAAGRPLADLEASR